MNSPLVCVSIEGHTVKECIKSAGLAALAGADMLEIRFDCLYLAKIHHNNSSDSENEQKVQFELVPKEVSEVDVKESIKRLKEAIEKPVIFTCRSKEEGGFFPGSEDERIEIMIPFLFSFILEIKKLFKSIKGETLLRKLSSISFVVNLDKCLNEYLE